MNKPQTAIQQELERRACDARDAWDDLTDEERDGYLDRLASGSITMDGLEEDMLLKAGYVILGDSDIIQEGDMVKRR